MESQVKCPHCQAPNKPTDAFCQSCGKALPRASSGPRVVEDTAIPKSAAGQSLMTEELEKQVKQVFQTLLAVGILQLTCGAILIGAMMKSGAADPNVSAATMLTVQFIVAAGFIGLAFWSRVNALPPAIIGFAIYIALVGLNIATVVSNMGANNGQRSGGIGGIGIGWLDIVIIVVLVRGIKAALRIKDIKNSQL